MQKLKLIRSTICVRAQDDVSVVVGHNYEWWTGFGWSEDRIDARVYDHDVAKDELDRLRNINPPLSDRYSHTLVDFG